MKHLILILTLSILSTQSATAEQYEIRAVNIGDGKISVQMRETTGNSPIAGDFLVDLVFGLKWNATYGIDLSNTISTNYEIRKSDVRKLKGGFHFQAFYANNLPLAIPADWNAGWIEIMNIQNSLDGGQVTGDFFICELGFDDTTEPDINVNLTGYYIPNLNGFAVGVALPIELLDFTAKKSNQQSLLAWTSAQEINANYFDIERSVDGNHWTSIERSIATGNSSVMTKYSFIDEDPMTAEGFQKNIYYRLKMVDNSGEFEYSGIRSLGFGINTTISLYPNPTQQTLFIKQNANRNSTINIYTANGKLLITQEMPATSSLFSISVSHLPSGIYLLTNGDGEMHRFIKTE